MQVNPQVRYPTHRCSASAAWFSSRAWLKRENVQTSSQKWFGASVRQGECDRGVGLGREKVGFNENTVGLWCHYRYRIRTGRPVRITRCRGRERVPEREGVLSHRFVVPHYSCFTSNHALPKSACSRPACCHIIWSLLPKSPAPRAHQQAWIYVYICMYVSIYIYMYIYMYIYYQAWAELKALNVDMLNLSRYVLT